MVSSTAAPPDSATCVAPRRAVLVAVGLLAVVALAAYWNTFSAPFVLDDESSITKNPTIRQLWPLGGAFSLSGDGVMVSGRPVMNFSLAVNYAISGEAVWSYHALNLLIHICAGLTLFGVMRQALRLCSGRALAGPVGAQTCCALGVGRSKSAPLQRDATLLACAVALIWLLHPLQTESVTYVSQRAESLMGLFYLLTLYGFIRSVTAESRNCWLILSVLACLGGMATKQVMVTAPVLVLLYDRAFVSGSFRSAVATRRWYYAGLAATWLWLGFVMYRSSLAAHSVGFQTGVSWLTYAMTELQVVTDYLRLAFWPYPLVFDYGAEIRVTHALAAAPYALVIAAILAGVVIAWRRAPRVGFLGCWFFLILAPTSTVVPIAGQAMAENRMYLPLAAVVVTVVTGLYAALGRRSLVLWPVLALGLGWLTFVRNETYGSELTLWRDTVAKVPGNARARNNYGNVLALAGRPEEALAQYREAIRIEPGNADAYYNAGKAQTRLGRLPEAIAYYEQALRTNPRLPDAQTAFGTALEEAGRGEEAVVRYEQALRLDPNYTDAHDHLGVAFAKAGRLPDAIAHFEQALRINPALPEVQNNLGNALRATGHLPEALAHYEEALRLNPNFAKAHHNLANALRDAERLPEAIGHYEQAVRLDPTSPEILNNFAIALLMSERTPEAITQLERALQLNPNLGQVHLNLAMALESIGRRAEASGHYATARRLGAAFPPPGN